jgi:hypothetical protein
MLKVVELQRTCIACPSQWEGRTDDGRAVYVRYRWGHLSVRVGKDITAAVRNRDEVFNAVVGHSYDGLMTYDKLKDLTVGFVEWPEEER